MAYDRTTATPGQGLPGAFQKFVQFVPLGVVAVILVDAATDFFPDDPLVGIVTPLRLLVVVGFVALLLPGPTRARIRDFRTRLDIPIGVLVLAATASTVHGGHPTAPLRGLVTVLACYYLVVGVRRTQPESWRAIGLLALVGVGAAATAAFSQFTNDTPTGFCRTGLLTDISCDDTSGDVLIRAIGTFANPNLLSAFLVLLVPFVLLAAVSVDERTARTAVVLVGAVGYAALLTTFSRAGYVAGAAGLLVLAGAYWLAPRLADRAQRRIVATLGALGLAAAAAAIWAVSQAGNSLGVRGQAWDAALTLAKENPLGVGLGRAGAVISATAPGDRVFVHAHNMWLNWLVETGALGLLAMLAVAVVAWLHAARIARAKSVLGTVGLASLTGFFLIGMMDHPANLDRIDILFWVVLAVVMAETPDRASSTTAGAPGNRHRQNSQTSQSSQPPQLQPLPEPRPEQTQPLTPIAARPSPPSR
ncbi:O-antigen ligase family protein [Streptomyces sp. NBC_00457]|uniref:O-antigen ligase family protein n=1 Tax=unclassified Streptomyces TaxID=2593676 RepID=UPI002E20B6BF|nr:MULTISPECIES: O-antigen ligase family protein [unclassified Streptomyces]